MDINSLVEEFGNYKIVVVGDVMVDAYLEGKVNRISPEAPVPVVNLLDKDERLGGAANVALNLLSFSTAVSICSVIGKDEEGERMVSLMNTHAIDTSGVILSATRKTTVKTRIIGNNQQLLRLDNEQTDDLTNEEEDELVAAVEKQLIEGVDALIFEDYNKGVLTANVIKRILVLAKKYNVITTVDPKHKNFFSYEGVTLFKPNLKELVEGVGRPVTVQDKKSFEEAVDLLKQKTTASILFITLSENGVFIGDDEEKIYFPAHKRSIADVSGAGDTVISVATLCLVAALDLTHTAQLANLAGGLVCEHVGVVAIDKTRFTAEASKLFA